VTSVGFQADSDFCWGQVCLFHHRRVLVRGVRRICGNRGLGPQRMCMLTSCPDLWTTSLVIVSDDTSLLYADLSVDPPVHCRYQAPPMIRRLLDLVAFQHCNPLLSKLPGILTHGQVVPGFQPGCIGKMKGKRSCGLRLRDFFGESVGPTCSVRSIEVRRRDQISSYSLRRILAPMPEAGPVFDDSPRDSSSTSTSHGPVGVSADAGDSLRFSCPGGRPSFESLVLLGYFSLSGSNAVICSERLTRRFHFDTEDKPLEWWMHEVSMSVLQRNRSDTSAHSMHFQTTRDRVPCMFIE
jgi:hypothetical protein